MLREIVDRMLGMVHPARYRTAGGAAGLDVTIGGVAIRFNTADKAFDRPFERLASAIEGCIAFERAQTMRAATGNTDGPPPLWLVAGSSVLAAWLSWSRNETALRRKLVLSDQADAPVNGYLARPTRLALGQGAIKIRVRSGLAVAERIELAGLSRCIMTLGRDARICIEGSPLPETVISALGEDLLRNDRRCMSEIVDHPFFTATDLKLAGIRNDGNAVVLDVESHWGPLMAVPEPAWRAIPRDADPTCPWRATGQEIAALYDQVDTGRQLAHRA